MSSRCRAVVAVRTRRRPSTLPAALRPPVMGVCRNPLVGLLPGDMHEVPIGVRLRDFVIEANGPLVCQYNGEYLYSEWWDTTTKPGDVIVWLDMPQSKASLLEIVIGYAVMAVGIFTLNPGLASLGVNIVEMGVLAGVINLLLPTKGPASPNQAAAGMGVFSSSLSGNLATLDTPIWKNCGRVKITPNFAAQPYGEYRPSNPLEPTVDCDQYVYIVFVLGIGNYEVEKAFIGKTPISHFQDVQRAQYLPPGTQPSVALCNVISSDEVSTPLELQAGVFVGGYTVCRPLDRCTKIQYDVGADQGLGRVDGDGNAQTVTITWVAQVREVDDYGSPLTNWQDVDSQSRTANTNTPQRWTCEINLASSIRPELRVGRTSEKDTSSTTRDGIQWIGLRGYLDRPALLNANAAHYEVVMRSSEQLSSLSQRDFSLIVRSLVRTWSPDTGWSDEVFSRNPAWWLADLWTSSTWGEGLPDQRINLAGLYAWAQTLDARQDRFDYTFSQASSAWDAAQLIARVGRARAFRAAGLVRSIARDELVDLPVNAFTPRTPGNSRDAMVLHTRLPQREQADGIIAQWLSNVTWDTASQECPCPGFSVSDPDDPRFDPDLPAMSNPVVKFYPGITGATHAEREGLYDAADMALRTTTVEWSCELQGVGLRYLDPVYWQPLIAGYGQSGDVAFWDLPTLVMGLTEPPDFSSGQDIYLTLQRDDGTLTTPVRVTPGPTTWDVTLPEAPDFTLVLDDGTRERPRFMLGPIGIDEIAKVAAVTDGGKTQDGAQIYACTGVVDDDRVHERDNPLLPGPGDIQDPIDDGTTTSDVDFSTVVNIDALGNRGLGHGVTISGLNPDWVLAVSLPTGQRYTAWSEWATDGDPFVTNPGHAWGNSFQATSDLGVGSISFGAMSVGTTAENARSLFSGGTLTGSTSWTFWFNSDGINDNRGGLSILVVKD